MGSAVRVLISAVYRVKTVAPPQGLHPIQVPPECMVECRYPVTSTRVGCVSCHSHSRPSPPLVRLSIGVAWCLGGVVQGGEHKGVESKDYRSLMGQGRSFFSMHRFSIIENIFYFMPSKAEIFK